MKGQLWDGNKLPWDVNDSKWGKGTKHLCFAHTRLSTEETQILQRRDNKLGPAQGAEVTQLVPVQGFEMHSWGRDPYLIYRNVASLHTSFKIRFLYQWNRRTPFNKGIASFIIGLAV